MKKSCCWVNCKWVIIHNRRVVLELLIYATEKKLDHATGVVTYTLTVKKRFYCFEGWNWEIRY